MNLGKGDGKVRGLLDKAKAQGFTFVREKKSWKVYPPDKTKGIIVVSCTPSTDTFYWELRRQLKKAGFVE